MNRRSIAIVISSIIVLMLGAHNFSAQADQNFGEKANPKEWIEDLIGKELPSTARIIKPFRTISTNWDMKKIFLLVGMPDKIGGFGLSICIYNLNDKTQVIIGVTDFEKPPIYVTHILNDGTKMQLLGSNK
jgi:hypothetical protein